MRFGRIFLFLSLAAPGCGTLGDDDVARVDHDAAGGSVNSSSASSVSSSSAGVGGGVGGVGSGGSSSTANATSSVSSSGSGVGGASGGGAGGAGLGGGAGGSSDASVSNPDAATGDARTSPMDGAAADRMDAARGDVVTDRSVSDVVTENDAPSGDPEPGRLAGITRYHNQVRAEVGVPGLTWDSTIAATAAAYAAMCDFQHSGAAGLGENLAAYAPPGGPAASAPIDDWASERNNYDYASNTCASGKVCGHYTQVVWKNSLRVGCAVQACSTNSPFMGFPNWEIWVCNYAPPGNVGSQKPY